MRSGKEDRTERGPFKTLSVETMAKALTVKRSVLFCVSIKKRKETKGKPGKDAVGSKSILSDGVYDQQPVNIQYCPTHIHPYTLTRIQILEKGMDFDHYCVCYDSPNSLFVRV